MEEQEGLIRLNSHRRALALPVLALALYVAVIAFPYPFFRHEVHLENIAVYSDQSISPSLLSILNDVQERLRKSPLNDPTLQHRLFICNEGWLFTFLANTDYRAGGVNKAWLNQNIFLRRSDIEKNRVIGPSGKEVPGERTLAYFITHEIAHSLEVHLLGRYAYIRLPAWKREGYADYLARDSEFVFAERLAALQNNAPEMDPRGSGLYLRYELFVAYLLDVARLPPAEMLTDSFAETALEHTLRAIHLRRIMPPRLNTAPPHPNRRSFSEPRIALVQHQTPLSSGFLATEWRHPDALLKRQRPFAPVKRNPSAAKRRYAGSSIPKSIQQASVAQTGVVAGFVRSGKTCMVRGGFVLTCVGHTDSAVKLDG